MDVELTRSRLHQGQLLDPDSCGWNYVAGLHADDDPRLAVLWDKAGLDHNGKLLLTGGHVVVFLNAEARHIAAKDWSAFEAEQKQLREMSFALRALAGQGKNPANKVKGKP